MTNEKGAIKYATQMLKPQMARLLKSAKGRDVKSLHVSLLSILNEIASSDRSPAEKNDALSACVGQYVLILMQLPEYQQEVLNQPDDKLAGVFAAMVTGSRDAESFSFRNIYACLSMGRWAQHGEKIYAVSPGLTQRLWNTRLTGVNADILRLPFPAIAIRLPMNMGLPFHEIMVVESPEYAVGEDAVVVTKGVKGSDYGAVEKKIREAGKCPRSWRITASRIENAHGTEETLALGAVRLWEGQDLEEALEESLYGEWEEETKKALAFAINVVLYTTWPDTGEEFPQQVNGEWAELNRKAAQLKGAKREKAREKLKEMWPERRIYLGAKVPFLVDTGANVESGTGNKLTVRTLVSGHWKMQAHGPRWTERKLIRVEPFWRGPMDGPVTNPIRRVS